MPHGNSKHRGPGFYALVLLASCATAWGGAAGAPFAGRIDALFASVRPDTPGAQVLVARDGKVLFEHAYGAADLASARPMTMNTRLRIGSISKEFTAAAILKLQEEGRLSLRDPLTKFIPDWPGGDTITLYHLLTHTSGLHNFTESPDFAAQVTHDIALEALVQQIKASLPDAPPGRKYAYNNSGYVLLAFVVEQVARVSYEAFLQRAFFDPLGMHDTGMFPSTGELERGAVGYRHDDGTFPPAAIWQASRLTGAGSLYSTAHDLFRWNEALFNGQILADASLQAAFTVGVLEGDDPTHPEETGYGLGWSLDTLRGHREISHGGELDGFASYLLRLPAQRLTVVVLLNCVPHQPPLHQWKLARDIATIALGDELPPEAPPVVNRAIPAEALAAIVGRYDMGSGLMMTVTRDGDRVFFEITGRPKAEMLPRTDRTFFVHEGEAEATFVRDAHDRVVKAILKQAGARIDAPRLP